MKLINPSLSATALPLRLTISVTVNNKFIVVSTSYAFVNHRLVISNTA